jgi:thiol-disulfide isomerase/thioredoxin
MKKRILFLIGINTSLILSSQELPPTWPFWKGSLQLNDSVAMEVPFEFEKLGDNKAIVTFINGSEKIRAESVSLKGDSVFIRMALFDSEFKLKLKDNKMSGLWINHARKEKNRIPFTAQPFKKEAGPMCGFCSHINGKWEVDFSPGTADSSKAIGVFKGLAHFVAEGTFLTETGDYRFLSGKMWRGKNDEVNFELQCFDGAHAFFFSAQLKDNKIQGDFYSGAHGHEKWTAKKNESFRLRDPEKITQVKAGSEPLNFTFPNLLGKNISLTDAKYKNKVTIVQIMGSWCPNCMDESKYLSEVYKLNKAKGLEIIGLAFEKTDNFKKASANVGRLKNKFGIQYELLISGKTGKAEASKTFPMLNEIIAFPTTIYIDKKGTVRKVYTGFSGPATGEEYEKFKKENEAFLSKLLSE